MIPIPEDSLVLILTECSLVHFHISTCQATAIHADLVKLCCSFPTSIIEAEIVEYGYEVDVNYGDGN